MKKKIKKTKKRFCLIKGTVYPFDVLITTEPYEKVLRYIEKRGYHLNDNEREELEMHSLGRTVMLRGGQTIIRLKTEKTEIGFDLSNLIHEISHATFFILNRCGVKHTDESDESFAYLSAYLTKESLIYFDKTYK